MRVFYFQPDRMLNISIKMKLFHIMILNEITHTHTPARFVCVYVFSVFFYTEMQILHWFNDQNALLREFTCENDSTNENENEMDCQLMKKNPPSLNELK